MAVLTVTLLLAGCGTADDTARASAPLRLGYLTNLTHASAVVGIQKGFFASELPAGTALTSRAFNAGPAEVEAMLGNALDAGFFGPSPAINAFIKSRGGALRVVAGATSGGAGLVIRSDLVVHSAAGLRGLRIATPQLGNTQDVALRAYLADHGLKTNLQGGGDVNVVPTDNATTFLLFKQKRIDAAWVPEPWTSRLVVEGHGTLFLDERTLWPHQQFPTTELVVSAKLLSNHRDLVEDLIRGHLQTTNWILQNPTEARDLAGAALTAQTQGKPLAPAVLASAWSRLTFSLDPLAAALKKEADNAQRVGLLNDTDLKGIIDVGPLDDVLRAAGRSPVDAGGLSAS